MARREAKGKAKRGVACKDEFFVYYTMLVLVHPRLREV
jgi:hypothetical protein